MRGGQLKHRFTIEENTPARDSAYEMVDSWSTFAVVWGAMEPLTGREYFAAKQVNAEESGRIKIRYLAGLNPAMRIRFKSRTLKIVSIINYKELNQEMHIYYKEDTD